MLPESAPNSQSGSHEAPWRVSEDLCFLKDHFPGKPLVPAYFQLARVREIAAAWIGISPERLSFRTMKFLRPLEPGAEALIRLEPKGKVGLFSVTLSVGQVTVAQGELSFT